MKYTAIFLIALIAFGAAGQNKPKQAPVKQTQAPPPNAPQQTEKDIDPLTLHFAKKHALAYRWNDFDQLKDALYDLIVENPGNDSLIFSLAGLYYDNRQYASAVLVAQDILANNSRNPDLLQLLATGYEAIGVKDKALTNYESLYLITNSTATLYKMAVLQFDLKRFAESKANDDILLTKPDIDSLNVTIASDNKQRAYPLKVAILNLKGMLALQANDKPTAKKAFEDALALAPEFPLAKENLNKLK